MGGGGERVKAGRFGGLCCGHLDAEEWGGGAMTDSAILQRSLLFLDSVEKLSLFDGPLLVLHSPEDPVCPWEQALALLEAPHRRGCLVRLDGVGHNNLVHPEYWSKLGAFLRETVALK